MNSPININEGIIYAKHTRIKNTTLPCKFCGSESVIKHGRHFNSPRTFFRHVFSCKACGKRFKSERIPVGQQPTFEYVSKPVPSQNWSAYSQAQKNEKLLLMQMLRELLDYLVIKEHNRIGRPSVDLKDMAFSLILKTFTGLSSRRLISDLEMAKQQGFIENVYDFTVLMDYLRDNRMTQIFDELYKLAALSLKQLEADFAVDSTGFSTSQFGRWFDHKWGKEIEKREWVKAHVMVGTRTNAITSIEITPGISGDSPQFEKLVTSTAKEFNVKEVSADKAYSSKKNLEIVVNLNAMPYIPFKEGITGKARGSMLWKKLFQYFQNNRQEFLEHYHKRSNVESSFNMIKSKFGSCLRTKSFQAQKNEILARAVCHNLCITIQEYFENNIEEKLPTETMETKQITIQA
ncbi:MAG: IS5 family transposase [Candidatus ainarchaeum sp.]|nr:IS5 family transposase [Candidatus ainarchaeum sp.]